MISAYIPNIYSLELCLTYRCNVKCKNCFNLCTQAPVSGDMPIDAIETMLNESVKYGYKWSRIVLHGGEPTLYPEYLKACKIIVNYRDNFNKEVALHTCSNGTNSFVQNMLLESSKLGIKSEVSVKVGTNKRDNGIDIPYAPVYESPEDLNIPWNDGCYITSDCGICFNYLGFFPCSPGGAAARVFNYSPICTSVKDLTKERLASFFKIHCKHCGFAMPERRRVIEQTNTNTWQTAFDKYMGKI